jgi:AAA+ ATPase superfamily predicted ATPase
MTSINPYITGAPVGNSPAFVGRDDILNNVLNVVRDQNNAIVLYGQRRIGKTSMLQVLETKLSEEKACLPVFFDFQDKAQQPVEQLLGELAYKISDGLNQATPNLGADPSSAFFQWLSEILNNLPTDKLVLLFDEFDVLADPESEQAGKVFFMN